MTTPPHDPQAEQALAGAAIDTHTWTAPLPHINPDDFYDPRWRRIYTIGHTARTNNQHIHPDELPPDLQHHATKATHTWYPPLEQYAQRIHTTAQHRQLIHTLHTAYTTAWTNPIQAIHTITTQLQRAHTPTHVNQPDPRWTPE